MDSHDARIGLSPEGDGGEDRVKSQWVMPPFLDRGTVVR